MSMCFFVSLGLSPQVTYWDHLFPRKKNAYCRWWPLPGEIDPIWLCNIFFVVAWFNHHKDDPRPSSSPIMTSLGWTPRDPPEGGWMASRRCGFFQLNNEKTPVAYSCLEYYIGDEMLPSSFPSKQPVQRKVRLFFVAQLFGRWVDVFLCGFAALFTALKLHLLPDVPGSTKFMGQDAYVAVSNPIPDNSDIRKGFRGETQVWCQITNSPNYTYVMDYIQPFRVAKQPEVWQHQKACSGLALCLDGRGHESDEHRVGDAARAWDRKADATRPSLS